MKKNLKDHNHKKYIQKEKDRGPVILFKETIESSAIVYFLFLLFENLAMSLFVSLSVLVFLWFDWLTLFHA